MAQPKITIYTLPTCAYCHLAMEFFKEKGLPFTEISVDKDAQAQKDMIVRSGQFSVPVIDINGQIIIGFQKSILEALI
ncbi:MAG: glutathione S-transferase N-terminal domain-containing protein [Candidatus Doudnabacteria bacterium]|nr:glutathione S-transferase N-terminal domain-containing protein [Candidatus Doudnabacteria bacterium]